MSQQRDHRHAAHRRHTAEQPGFCRPQRRIPNRLLQGRIELSQLFTQPADVSGDGAIDTLYCPPVPITLGRQHFDHLSAPCDQCHQFASLRVWQRSSLRLDKFGEMRQDPRIDRVGFRQSARRASKVAYLARIDHCHRQTCGRQLTGCRDFVTTASFQHDAADVQLLQTFDQGRNAALIVGHAEAFITRSQRHIEPRFRHIDSDEHLIFQAASNAQPILARCGFIAPGDCSGPAPFLSGRDDHSATHGLKNLEQGRPVTPGLTQILRMQKIQGQGAAAPGSRPAHPRASMAISSR